MTEAILIERKVHFGRKGKCSEIRLGSTPEPAAPGRVPRVARLMALAIRLDGLIRSGALANPAEAARLGHVTRARMSQILSLLNLAPTIQESILFLPPTLFGRDAFHLHDLRTIAMEPDWSRQRKKWQTLIA